MLVPSSVATFDELAVDFVNDKHFDHHAVGWLVLQYFLNYFKAVTKAHLSMNGKREREKNEKMP